MATQVPVALGGLRDTVDKRLSPQRQPEHLGEGPLAVPGAQTQPIIQMIHQQGSGVPSERFPMCL